MNAPKDFEIPYPRVSFRRKVLDLTGRILIRLLSRVKISGLENIPPNGAVILAGNHVSTLEPMLLAVFPRRQVELLGAGDLPFEGLIDQIVALYQFIPVNRGNLDRKAMNQAFGVLQQGGVLGIFPEGGTWNPGHMKAQVGVSWLSHKAHVPVVPIGFSGFQNSFSKVLKLKRPRLKMKVGKLIPALTVENDNEPIKTVYQEYADMVLQEINKLVDPKDFLLIPEQTDYNLEVLAGKIDNAMRAVHLTSPEALAQFLFSPILLNSLAKNLKKPVQPLYPLEQPRWNQQFSTAIEAVLDVLTDNPGFFTYRLGMEQGHHVESALQELLTLLKAARDSNEILVINASARSKHSDGRVEQKSYRYRIPPIPEQTDQT
jgi:1-acyl-sn-glycerol-3-phosphate acyltransferase